MRTERWYVVFEGRTRGIFDNWDECKASVNGYKGQKYKGYEEAEAAWNDYETTGKTPY